VDNLATDAISADSIAAAAVTKVQSGLATSTAMTTLSNVFTGITRLAGWLRLMSRTDAATATDEATALAELNADGGSGAGTFANTTDSLESIVNRGNVAWSGGGGSALSGPNTITVTVTNTADNGPIQGAFVRFYRTGESGTQATDADGETEFTVGSFTWSVAIAANGFVGQTNTLVVSDNAAVTYQLTAATITASEVGKSTGYATVLDEQGAAEVSVPVFITMTAAPTGSGNSFDTVVRKVYSSDTGLVQFPNMIRGATYDYWRSETGKRFSVTVPDTDTFAFPNFLGKYAVQ
jgi:hypothetical protein